MATEQDKLGQPNGIERSGPKTFAQALVRTSAGYLNTDYGNHANELGVGGPGFHHPHTHEEVNHGK
jgi:hypothetical protein